MSARVFGGVITGFDPFGYRAEPRRRFGKKESYVVSIAPVYTPPVAIMYLPGKKPGTMPRLFRQKNM